jgi:hypothetical protein
MFADKAAAKIVIAKVFFINQQLESLIGDLEPFVSNQEVTHLKRQIGSVMVENKDRFLDPIFETHPDLLPDTWKDWWKPSRHSK